MFNRREIIKNLVAIPFVGGLFGAEKLYSGTTTSPMSRTRITLKAIWPHIDGRFGRLEVNSNFHTDANKALDVIKGFAASRNRERPGFMKLMILVENESKPNSIFDAIPLLWHTIPCKDFNDIYLNYTHPYDVRIAA